MQHTICPLCGRQIELASPLPASLAGGGWTAQPAHVYQMPTGVTQAVAAGAEYERRQPARAPQADDYKVPLAQSGITALMIGAPTGGIIAGLATQQAPLALVGAGLGFIATLAPSWVFFLRQSAQTLWITERLTAPEKEPEPPPPAERGVAYEILDKGEASNTWLFRFGELPPTISESVVQKIAHALLVENCELSRRGLAHVVSQDDYQTLYNAMKRQSLLFSTGNKNILTGSGRRLLEKFL